MGKEIKLNTDKKFVLVTEKGIASFQLDPEEAMGLLLGSFLEMWDEQCNSIDIVCAGDRIMDLLANMDPDEKDEDDEVEDVIRGLFDEEGNG